MTWIAESDEWGAGPSILGEDSLARVRAVLEESFVIVEHRYYRGSRAPECVVLDNYDDFLDRVQHQAQPGDSFYVWRYDALCRDDNALVAGKRPDAAGRVPKHGPY